MTYRQFVATAVFAAALLIGGVAWAGPLPAAVPATASTASAHAPLTVQTRTMGGPRPAQELALSVKHMDLSVKILPRQERIEADAVLTLHAKSPVDVLILDFYSLYRIEAVYINGHQLVAGDYSDPKGQLRIRLSRPLAAGDSIKTRVVYSGSPHIAEKPPWHCGVVWSKTPDGKPWVGMCEWGVGCDLLYPCIDEPSHRIAVADLHYTVPEPLVAPGNGTLVSVTETHGWRTYNWRVKSPNSYSIALNAGPFKLLKASYRSRYGNIIPLRFWYLPSSQAKAAELFKQFPSILDFFESEIGPYPSGSEKMGVVQTPYDGEENQTINSYGHHFVKSPYGFDFVLQHEFSHEYFANTFLANYDDIWMHEGLASYMQPLYAQWLDGNMDYYAWLANQRKGIRNRAPLVSGRNRTVHEVYFAKDGPAGDIYSKGSLVAYTLRNLMGDRKFFDSLRLLIYGRIDPRPGNYTIKPKTTQDYVKIVSRLMGRDMSWFFDVYLYHAALPKLVEKRDGDLLKLSWKTPGDVPFPMPVDVRVGNQTVTVPMSDGHGKVAVPAGSTVTVDPDSKVLRQSPAIQRYQRWQARQRAKRS